MRLLSILFSFVAGVAVFAQPTITSFSPTSGPVGTTVTISGTGFSTTLANNTVFVGSAKANVTSANSTTLTVTIPAVASSNCKIQVIVSGTNNLCALSKTDFTYTYPGGVSSTGAISDHFSTVSTEAVGPGATESTSFPVLGSRNIGGDFDNDGDMDYIVLAASNSTTMRIFKNTNINPSSTSLTSADFTTTDYTMPATFTSLAYYPADMNNDGKLDLIYGNYGTLGIFLNSSSNGDISFSHQSITTSNTANYRFKVFDFNNDGILDIVTTGNQTKVNFYALSWTNGNVSAVTSSVNTTDNVRDIAISDVNLDGKSDVVYITLGSTVSIQYSLNNTTSSTITFGNAVDIETGISAGSYSSAAGGITTADFDNDGDFDIVFSLSGGAGELIRLIALTGSLNFTSSIGIGSYTASSNIPCNLRCADLNGDAKIDLLIVGGSNSANIRCILNNYSSGNLSASSFTTQSQVSTSNFGAAIEDFNGDGKIDIISNGYYNTNIIFRPNVPPAPPAVTITQDPSTTPQSICNGTNASTLTITASNATNYQWQVSFNSGAYTNVSGATTSSFTPTALTTGTYQYKCIASNSGSTLTSAASGLITVNATPTLTTNLTTTVSQNCYNPSSTTALTVATSAGSPSYQWQVSTNNSTFTNVVTANGSGGTTASFIPTHADILYGNTKYYRCVVTSSGCSTTSNSKPFSIYASLTSVTIPSTTNENYCINGTPNNLVMQYTGDNNLVYQWSWGSTSSGPWNTISGATATTYTPPTNTANTRYYRCGVSGTCSNTAKVSGAITVTDTYTWTGATSTDPTVAGNWNPAAVPCSGANEVIPSGLTNYPVYTNLTIDAGTTLTVNTGGRLTVTGTLTNNGTMTIESGATFVQGTSLAGSGTYNVKQFVTGAGGSTPSGRFWYMGLPINNLSRQTAFGAASASNRLWSWSESAQAWSSQITDATALTPTTGYVFRTGADVTLTFTGTSLYSADASITGLTNTTGSFDGCHLMSNPYTAYLDWDQIAAAAGTTNLSSTVTVRSYNTSNSQMVYDTYNATGSVAVQNSSYAVSKYIAPMQSFWVVVNPSTTGTLSMTKAMLTHQPTAPGLKDLTSFPAFARLNLVDGSFTDQVVIYTDAEANAELEAFDSKKFFLPNVAQVYCKVGNDKLVINALKKGKAQTSAPLTVELPSTKVYKFEMAESFVESGLVILEDRQEGIFQDMGINPTYEFFGNSGVIADRFVLHFQLPNGASNEGQAGVEDLTSSQIAVISNQNGSILVSLSADLTATGEVQVLDAAGRLIQTTAIKGQDTKLQITEGTGVYFVRVSTPMKSETKKVLVY